MSIPATGNLAQTIVVDTVLITGFTCHMVVGQGAIIINYETGYNDVNGNFVTVNRHNLPIVGDDLDPIMDSQPDTTNGLLAAIEAMLQVEVDKAAAL